MFTKEHCSTVGSNGLILFHRLCAEDDCERICLLMRYGMSEKQIISKFVMVIAIDFGRTQVENGLLQAQ